MLLELVILSSSTAVRKWALRGEASRATGLIRPFAPSAVEDLTDVLFAFLAGLQFSSRLFGSREGFGVHASPWKHGCWYVILPTTIKSLRGYAMYLGAVATRDGALQRASRPGLGVLSWLRGCVCKCRQLRCGASHSVPLAARVSCLAGRGAKQRRADEAE